MSAGFRYSLRIPEFAKEERTPDDIVVTFQVDILVQMPDSQETNPPTSVWRRFSEFRQLFVNLKEAFPDIFQDKSLEPPPKKKFRFVNNSDKLLEERRKRLEQWLWKLLRFPEIARSREMKLFLQLDLALRAGNIGGNAPKYSRELGSPEEGSEPDTDASSMLSVPTTSISHFNGHSSLTMSISRSPPSTAINDRAEGNEPLRMGLRVEQRSDLKNVIGALSAYVAKANYDLHEVVEENQKLRQEKSELAERLLKAESKAASSPEIFDKVVDQSLAAEASTTANLEVAEGSSWDDQHTSRSQAEIDNALASQAIENRESVARLKQEIDILTKEIADNKLQTNSEKLKFKQDNRLLAKEIARLRENNKELGAEVSTLRQALEEQPHVTQITSLKSNIKDLEERLEESNKSSEQAKINMETASAQSHAEQSARINELTEACENYKHEKTLLADQKNELERLVELANKEKLQATDQLGIASKSLENQLLKYDEQHRVCDEQKTLLISLETRIDHLEKDKSHLEKELQTAVLENSHLSEEASNMHALKELVQSLQSQLTSTTMEKNQLVKERAELKSAQEDGSQEHDLSQEVLAMRQENTHLQDEKSKVEVECTKLKEEVLLLQDQGSRCDALKLEIQNLELCVAQLKEENNDDRISAKQVGVLEAVIEDFTQKVTRLESENRDLRAIKAELESQTEQNSGSTALETDSCSRALLEEQTLALDNALAEVSTLKQKLSNAQERCAQAEERVLALSKEVQQLETNMQSLEAASRAADSDALAHTTEVLRLQTELDSLRFEYSQMARTLQETNGPQSDLKDNFIAGIRVLLTEIHGDISSCTASVPSLSGQAPLDADVATELMEKVAECNGKLQLVTARVDDIRSSVPDSSGVFELAGSVADLVSDLIGKCREVNEIRVDQFLSRCETPSQSINRETVGEPVRSHKKHSFGGLSFSELGQGRRGTTLRNLGSGGQGSEEERGQMVDGDSKVKKFWGEVGSKVSAKSQGLMNFMQRNNLQAGLLDDARNDDPSMHPSTSQQ